jgi:hypothetical protein
VIPTLCRAVSFAALALLAIPIGALGQTPSESTAILLAHSEVESILGGFRPGVEDELTGMGFDVSPRLLAALDQYFSLGALMPLMHRRFEAQGRAALMTAAAALAERGAISRVESTAESAPPSTSLEEYVAALDTAPPARQRIQLVAQLAAAQAAGDFFVLLSEGLRQAAHVIADVEFEPISDQQWQEAAQQALLGAVVGFLHRYENVSDADLAAALEEWTSEPGSWYVQAYSLALAETALEAAELAAEQLGR